MRVLVTGGAGYIGSIAVEMLREAGLEVVVLDNFWKGHRAAIEPGVPAQDVDLRDAAGVAHVVAESKPDAVMHFGAVTIVPESVTKPDLYYGVNAAGGHNLLSAMLAHGCERIVFSSTAAVYGSPARVPILESDPLQPINPYGESKLMFERMLESYATAYGLRYAALRYFNVAGATERHGEDHRPETHLVPSALQAVLGVRPPIDLYGADYPTADGTAIRDYVHVADLIDAHIAALRVIDDAPGAINLGTRTGYSVAQVLEAVEATTGLPVPHVVKPRREGDAPALIADTEKSRQVLGWEAFRSSLEQIVGSAWEWMQRHPGGYEGDPAGR